MSEFGGRLRQLREAGDLTQEALARAANVSLSTVVKLERGAVKPAWDTVRALARALGVSCQAFEDEADNARPRGRRKPD
jgi:transcriptional regulator with XRE-family HTH domain